MCSTCDNKGFTERHVDEYKEKKNVGKQKRNWDFFVNKKNKFNNSNWQIQSNYTDK